MPGAALSRWTMTYFAAALLFLILGETMMVAGYGFPSAPLRAPETLMLVHIVAIGWLTLLMLGALLQFVPVLVGRSLRAQRLALPALLLILVGLLCLEAGFAALAGMVPLYTSDLAAGAAALVLGVAMAVMIIGLTLWQARPLTAPARFVAIGIGCLVVTAMLGGAFALELSGIAENEIFSRLDLNGLSIHAVLGLGGWMSFTAIGVSYRLLMMFMLSPDSAARVDRAVLWIGAGALMLVAAGVPFIIAFAAPLTASLTIAGILGVVVVGLYVSDVVRIYRKRVRKTVELNSSASVGAYGALVASAALLAIVYFDHGDYAAAALTYAFVFGWLTGLGLAQLYKIIPFLTWLECYGPVLGKSPTPRVQDLVREKGASVWFVIYYASVAAGTICILSAQANLFRGTCLVQLLATLVIVAQYVRARCLADVAPALQLPHGARRPNLFLSRSS
ncbi:hypothetical protein CU102_26260 [Phyllobacterium brassicacearum]|uniref:Cytochrome C oxidase subunit I n=1 Tax=Phyllobacterium brassicacearum TaxID=314235 RepID=A0A2P7B698_9HYPH|nr:hypothetical protein [Phyllobacterium brassicacearum]PSH61995.1 hypothetical protein CU102_26260 [Phyllobacterium brassicacearum]TDQ14896.1 hypothetical protein DEV91_13523 [Phyllobacterium brassicacearum]